MPPGDGPSTAYEINQNSVRVTDCHARLCFDWEAGEVWGTANYDIRWLDDDASKLVLDAVGLDVIAVTNFENDDASQPKQEQPGCSHRPTEDDMRRRVGCCEGSSGREKTRLHFSQNEETVAIRVPKGVRCVRVRYRVKDGSESLKWWRSCKMIHSTGADINNQGLLPVIDSTTEIINWKITVCVPDTFSVWVPNEDQTDPVPVHVHLLHQSDFEPPTELEQVIRMLLKGMFELFDGFGFKCYTIVAIPRGWNLQGLALPHGAFANVSVLERCVPGNLSAIQVLAHEMSHEWFGFQVRSLHMQEAWLDEAFAVYCEARIPQLGMDVSKPDCETQFDLIGCMRESLLDSAINGLGVTEKNVLSGQPDIVKHKGFLVILRLMRAMGGAEEIDKLIRGWCHQFRGRKVTTKHFVAFFEQYQFEINNFRGPCAHAFETWLGEDEMPKELRVMQQILSSRMADDARSKRVLKEIEQNVQQKQVSRFGPWRGSPLERERWCIALELLTKEVVDRSFITELADILPLDDLEVRGRFLELALAKRVAQYYPMVREFITEHQCMGCYLLADLLLASEKEKKLAVTLYRELQGTQTKANSVMTDLIFEIHLPKKRRKNLLC
eukprot:gene19735-30412_t